MNEDRLINVVLWIALALGTAGLVLFHFAVPEHPKTPPVRPSLAQVETQLPGASRKGPAPSPAPAGPGPVRLPEVSATAPVPPGPARVPEKPAGLETQATEEVPAAPPLSDARKQIPLAPKTAGEGAPDSFPEPSEALALLEKAGLMKSPKPEEKTAPAQDIIRETTGANGTFYSSQQVTEGLIIGKRGAADDQSDYYRVQASGRTMTLALEPIPEEESRRFRIFLFDADLNPIPEPTGGGGPAIVLEVTPQALYYIRVDLSKAPIETTQYRLSLKFK